MAKNWYLPWGGHCRCGQLHIQITAAPIMTAACHCAGCQRMSASAYSMTAMIPSDGFAVTRGEPVIGGLHGEHRHFFCSHCKSWMFTRPHGFDQFVNVRPTMLDDSSWFIPFIETYTSAKFSWVSIPAVHSFAEFPPMANFAKLIAEYTEYVSKPPPTLG